MVLALVDRLQTWVKSGEVGRDGRRSLGTMMAEPQSVTRWIHEARAGQDDAFQRIWERYHGRLVQLARRRMASMPRRAADEEDIAASAFSRFFKLIVGGQFPKSADRDDLWRLLISITAGKVVDYARAETSLKRGGGKVRGESVFGALNPDGRSPLSIEQIVGDEPTPEFAVEVVEQFRELMDLLGNDELKSIAQRKFEGCTNAEISEQIGCSLSKVERSLSQIRENWKQADT